MSVFWHIFRPATKRHLGCRHQTPKSSVGCQSRTRRFRARRFRAGRFRAGLLACVAWACVAWLVQPTLAQAARNQQPAAGQKAAGQKAAGQKAADQKAADQKALGEQEQTTLLQIRQALAARQNQTAADLIAQAQKEQGSAEFTQALKRLQRLADLQREFFQRVDRGGQILRNQDEAVINGKRVAIVDYQNGVLTYRSEGVNKRLPVLESKGPAILLMASYGLDLNSGRGRLLLGTFHALDRFGDRSQAKNLWKAAGQAGEQVDELLPELEAAPATPQQLPKLTRAQALALAPQSWALRQEVKGRVNRGAVNPQLARQSRNGHLQLTHPQNDAPPFQLVTRRRIRGDFRARIVVHQVAAGQAVGLYAATNKAQAFTVPLPVGTAEVEFRRQDQKLSCQINGEPAEITPHGDPNSNLVGQLGVEVAPGTGCVIALFQLQ